MVLALALALHGALLTWLVFVLLDATPVFGLDLGEYAIIVLPALAGFALLMLVWGRHARGASVAAVAIVAMTLFSPGTVTTVALMLFNAWLVGDRALAWAARDTARLPPPLAILAGFALWIGVMSATATMKVHIVPVYVLMLALPVLAFPARAGELLGITAEWLADGAGAFSAVERSWVAVLGTIVVVHLFVAAKPEVGYDATAVHLLFAQLFTANHQWDFDVTRFAWADMPLGADFAFAAAHVLGGEGAARLLNLAFGMLLLDVVYRLALRHATRAVALASVCALASMPLAVLVSGSLFGDNLWTAFLLACLLAAVELPASGDDPRSKWALPALALLAAGSMHTKVISVVWLAPLFVYVAWRLRRMPAAAPLGRRALVVIGIAAIIGVWPYANAWVRTGNPVFPFFNSLFRSRYFDAAASFDNPLYHQPLRPWTPYEIVMWSGRFIEGESGAAGLQWLLLFPLIAAAFFRRRPRVQWACLALAVIFFVGVYLQQSYLRYLLPALVLVGVLGSWALADLPDRRITRIAILVVGTAVCLGNLRFASTASWTHGQLCPKCSINAGARRDYIAHYDPQRIVADYLNQTLPDARVGFYELNGPGPSGFVGYGRAANWHDHESYRVLANANSADDVLTLARLHKLTHVVVIDGPPAPDDPIAVFRDRYTRPVWRFNRFLVAEIDPRASPAPAGSP